MDSYAFTAALRENSGAAADSSARLYFTILCYSPDRRNELLAKMANTKQDQNVFRLVQEDLARFDLNTEIVKFRFPVLVGTGRFDINVAPVVAYKIHRAISGSALVIFERSGHLPFFEEAEKFVSVVNAFLSGASPGR
jgi:proline iminopeptidase